MIAKVDVFLVTCDSLNYIITKPKAERGMLICRPSLNLLPVAPVYFALSESARLPNLTAIPALHCQNLAQPLRFQS